MPECPGLCSGMSGTLRGGAPQSPLINESKVTLRCQLTWSTVPRHAYEQGLMRTILTEANRYFQEPGVKNQQCLLLFPFWLLGFGCHWQGFKGALWAEGFTQEFSKVLKFLNYFSDYKFKDVSQEMDSNGRATFDNYPYHIKEEEEVCKDCPVTQWFQGL